MPDPGLFGIENSNKDLTIKSSWGKNQFNNLFPVGMACYLRSLDIDAVFIKLENNLTTSNGSLSINALFGSDLSPDDLYFEFEAKYHPFARFVSDNLESIDLVIKRNADKEPIRPIEIKLTTLPDNSTCDLTDSEYGSELVVRDKTTRYMALSMAESCEDNFNDVRAIFQPTCQKIVDWSNIHEMQVFLSDVLEALETFLSSYCERQRPLLIQPIWKTVGKSSELAENCLDIFVWSDFALTRLFMDAAKATNRNEITRQQRAALRLARFLYEVSSGNPVNQAPIYDGMTFGTLNDKEFSITGRNTNSYMRCDRLENPVLSRDALKEIIQNNGQNWLSPERRFDAIVYYSNDLFE